MLTELRIENFAIIQHLELNFKSGLSTFTGETGAGKSIILDAITALIGGKADATFIRSGADKALVEGVFTLSEAVAAEVNPILEREDLLENPGEVSLARELRREGRSVTRVNGRSVSQSLVRELGSHLIDIHGQSEHLSLLDVNSHRSLLDRYAGTAAALAAYRQVYRRLQEVRKELRELRAAEQDALRRADLLSFQVNEIEAAHLKAGEEDELRQERDRLANAESLASLAQQCVQMLDEGTPESPSLTDLLGQVSQSVSAISRMDGSQSALNDAAQTASDLLNDLARDLRDYLDQIEFNPRRLEQVEERLELLRTLQRKYGGSVESVLAFARDARQKLELIQSAGEQIEALEAQEQAILPDLARLGLELSDLRRAAANTMSAAIDTELDDLRMAEAHFAVDLKRIPAPEGLPLPDGTKAAFDDSGLDKVEFLIAPNPGEGLKPLVKIASGGETSRLMLALKNVLARADEIPTLIFDEIDQGIGGRVGMVVGEKLWTLGRNHQVLCVTHLPQLAAFGDQHFRVRKLLENGRTVTDVQELAAQPRLDELAQMLGQLSDASRAAAQEALDLAHRRAQELAGR